MKKLIWFASALILMIGCTSRTEREKEIKPKKFEVPQIPAMLTEPVDSAIFLAEHYWDKFDFSDTAYCHVSEITEQAFANFLDLLNHVPKKNADFSIKSMLKRAETDSVMYTYFVKLYDDYLYNPNSPVRNEEYYISALESQLASNKVSDIMKVQIER